MMAGPTDYDATVTELCERMLVTVVGDAGFWGRRLFLVGGLVPRYLYGPSRAGAQAYVGSRDVDLTVVLMVDYPTPDSYATLERNLLDAGFRQAPFAADPAYRWRKEANAASLILEFIVDTEAVPPGREFAPGARSGSAARSKPRFQALNVRGSRLVSLDCKLVLIGAERLDHGGAANVGVQVAGLLPFIVLKMFTFVDRHHARDVYDIVWTLANHRDGPEGAGREMAASPVAADPLAVEAVGLLRGRFAEIRGDAPMAYAAFLGVAGDRTPTARLRIEAVETVRAALKGFDRARAS
jgi:hypothetical protein